MSAKGSISAVEALAELEQLPVGNCTRTAQRYKGAQLVANETKIAAIRISTNGWEASVLHGLQVTSMRLYGLHYDDIAAAQPAQGTFQKTRRSACKAFAQDLHAQCRLGGMLVTAYMDPSPLHEPQSFAYCIGL